LTLLAPTGERMSFYEAARQYDKKALQVIASILMDAKQPASLRLAAASRASSKSEGINASIGANIEAVRSGNQCLEVTQTGHRGSWRRDQRLASISAKTVKPIVTFCADDPYCWTSAAIDSGHDWRS